MTITSALGDTTIESKPERIATWGWGATDAVLALGIQPVAIPADDYSGGDDKMPDWIAEAVDRVGGEAPTILDSSAEEIPLEALLKTNPDVLLAPYSGLTQKEFDAVSAAGIPVVAYPDAPWTTPWRDVITITGKALGLPTEADALLQSLDARVADAAAAHPEFAGTTIAYVDDDVDTFYLYLPADARVVARPLDVDEFVAELAEQGLDQLDDSLANSRSRSHPLPFHSVVGAPGLAGAGTRHRGREARVRGPETKKGPAGPLLNTVAPARGRKTKAPLGASDPSTYAKVVRLRAKPAWTERPRGGRILSESATYDKLGDGGQVT